MARTVGPLMSLDASGSIGKAITFSKWKGRNYVRRLVKPSQPRSGAQVGRRAMMRFLAQRWDAVSTAEKATWQDHADRLVASLFNAYVSLNMQGWHNFLAPSVMYPPTRTVEPSDKILSAALWEENRIKITAAGTAPPTDAWGIIIFASTTGTFDTSVGNAVLAELSDDEASQTFYWTPPGAVGATWYFDSRTFTEDGSLGDEGGEISIP